MTTAVILAAGRGNRMRSDRSKVLHEICGAPLLWHVLDTALKVVDRVVIVVSPEDAEEIEARFATDDVLLAVQVDPRGTGDALFSAREAVGDSDQLLVLCGDTPLLREETLQRLVSAGDEAAAAVLTANFNDPTGYGRILRDEATGDVRGIVEEVDADERQRLIREVNAGAYLFRTDRLGGATGFFGLLEGLDTDNAQSERYLTDVVALLVERGDRVAACNCEDSREVAGVNTQVDLARVGGLLRERILRRHMLNGVTIVDPATTYIDIEVEIGQDTIIQPMSVIQSGCRIGAGCSVGPFSHVRVGTVLEDGAAVGNFVETKKARLGKNAKAKHHSYLGDADVGAEANIGAGTICANYDGIGKHRTVIRDGAFVGSGTIFVAPVIMGAESRTGAGAVVTRNKQIPAGETWVGVPAQRLRTPAEEPAEEGDGAS